MIIIEGRQGKLILELNTKVKENVGFYDPTTGTVLSIAQPRTLDLNRYMLDRRTGKKLQMDVSDRIDKGVRSGVLRVVEGMYTDSRGKTWQATAQAPVIRKSGDPEAERQWKLLVQNAMVKQAVKRS